MHSCEAEKRLFGISQGHSIGVPNSLGVRRGKPQQVGDSGPLLMPIPKDPEKLHPSSSEDRGVDLRARGFTTEMAAELRQRLLTFEEDWNAPGMEAYDEL